MPCHIYLQSPIQMITDLHFSERVALEIENGDNDISISVTNNFTTGLTYHMNITQTSLGSSKATLFSMFGTNEHVNFKYPNSNICDIFFFIVTPIAMEMEGRPSEPVTGFFTTVTGTVNAFFSECLNT